MINTVTHEGVTYIRKGKAMSHAVVTLSTKTNYSGAPRPLVEWASSLELAQKNHSAILARADKVARTGSLGGVFSAEYYSPEHFKYSVIVEATHG